MVPDLMLTRTGNEYLELLQLGARAALQWKAERAKKTAVCSSFYRRISRAVKSKTVTP